MGKYQGCCPLQTQAKMIAVFQMVISIMLLGLAILYLVGACTHTDDDYTLRHLIIVMSSLTIFYCVAKFGLGIVLWKGAGQKNERYCKIWMVVLGILSALESVQLLSCFVLDVHWITLLFPLFLLSLQALFLLVVYSFRKEILVGGGNTFERGDIAPPLNSTVKYSNDVNP